MMIKFVTLLSLCYIAVSVQDITKFGAIFNEDTLLAQKTNQNAIQQAINKANSSDSVGDDRVILVPSKTFYTLPFNFNYCKNVIF